MCVFIRSVSQQLQDDTIRLRIRNVLGLLGFESKITASLGEWLVTTLDQWFLGCSRLRITVCR